MIRMLIAAPTSGSGKTTLTCAVLEVLKRRGAAPCAFKSGPDYIDPMFHRAVLGVESHNLDLFFSSPAAVRALYARGAAGHAAAVCEGAMGYYDGLAGTDAASAWRLADTLELPVLLCVRPQGVSLTLAAQLLGLQAFRSPNRLAGIVLNACSERYYRTLAPLLERETGLPVLGYLPPLAQAAVPSRHLGLYTAAEVADLQQKLSLLADTAEQTLDWSRLEQIFAGPAPAAPVPAVTVPPRVRIAVARDEAFCFAYAETLEALEQAGAQLCFFSPLRDAALPAGAGGLYLPGGYPELHAQALAQNEAMRRAVRAAVAAGLPTAAECGGFLYLGQELEDEAGARWPMVGALPGRGFAAGRLVRFGYAALCAQADSLLFRAGERWPAHEFHHWDSTACGEALTAQKPGGAAWRCGYTTPHLYAAFAHLYWAGTPLPQRFVQAAAAYLEGKNDDGNGT